MKYQILLSDRKNGREALIECPANMVLEELSVKIKIELQLPYTDYGYHRFLFRGNTYIIDDHLWSEPEYLWEVTGHYDFHYKCSERIRLNRCFTVLGSAITYMQDGTWYNEYKVRCTLVARV